MLKLMNVTKKFSEDKGIFDVNLEIETGTIVGVLGRNGSGKTTLLKSILNLYALNKGEILFDDKAVAKQYERVAYICEGGSFLSYMSAQEYGLFLARYYQKFSMEDYETLLTRFEVESKITISKLSRGQQLKVEIAAGLAMHADLLVLDEPFNSLDVYAKEDTVKCIIEQFHEDQTILISTHNIEEIEQVIERCIIIDHAHIVEDITMESLVENHQDLRDILDKYRPLFCSNM